MRGKAKIFRRWSAEMGITPAYAGKSLLCMDFCPAYRDHPRVCGEKYYVTVGKADHEGSPPRMRGKVRAAPLGAGDAGITPAYAGKSQPWRSYSQRRWNHPRVCGEKHTNISVRPIPPGSPPRMRGKVDVLPELHALIGITPAYAGKRARPHYHMILYGDHPRVCGEKAAILCKLKLSPGSPPRMRGKEANRCMQPPKCGITPAYAGKRHAHPRRACLLRDHPRVCGEKAQHRATWYSAAGSPPRMRGKASMALSCLFCLRITPAYAGKSLKDYGKTMRNQDHPRVCGEKMIGDECLPVNKGSPPRMRGKAMLAFVEIWLKRITPAYAGKRQRCISDALRGWDHPRVCGEKKYRKGMT